jgi:hypothetical protein
MKIKLKLNLNATKTSQRLNIFLFHKFDYCTFRVASSLINSKKWRRIFLEIMKANGQKTRKFVIALKMALHWDEAI